MKITFTYENGELYVKESGGALNEITYIIEKVEKTFNELGLLKKEVQE